MAIDIPNESEWLAASAFSVSDRVTELKETGLKNLNLDELRELKDGLRVSEEAESILTESLNCS